MADKEERPAEGEKTEGEVVYKIKVRLHDRETGQTRDCTLHEAQTWDWGNPEIWRMVNGWQLTSFQQFLNLLYHKMERGEKEVEIMEAPRFMMLSGG